MTVIDLEDPKVMGEAIASGLIWHAPTGAIRAACEAIAAGKYPVPAYVPQEWQPLIDSLAGKPMLPANEGDGSGPA